MSYMNIFVKMSTSFLVAGALAAHRPLQMKETLKRRLIG
jgi:hypothetical protein